MDPRFSRHDERAWITYAGSGNEELIGAAPGDRDAAIDH
jgi:hypothetical protein